MSYLDYKFSMGPVVGPKADPPFDGLIMAAMRRADLRDQVAQRAYLRSNAPEIGGDL